MSSVQSVSVEEIPAIAPSDPGEAEWKPVRHHFGITSFGANAYVAREAGEAVVVEHTEVDDSGTAHEELYFVASGRARFSVAGEEVDAPAGTCILVEVGTHRAAVAAEPGTRVLAIGGHHGAALPASPFEYYYAAQPAYDAGDFDRAVAIASEGLSDWPDHPIIHYQLACFHARAGRLDEARRSLDIAFAGDERTRQWADTDEDLAALRA
jgi:tetratricopeptide (TPR) repeat protein